MIIVASVSCIYGIGSPEAYQALHIFFRQGEEYGRDTLLRKLVEIQYERNDMDFHRGTFRVRGDVVEVFPAYDNEKALRIEFFGDEVEAISEIDPLRGVVINRLTKCAIYPASHYVSTRETLEKAVELIRVDLGERIRYFREQNMLLEAQRIEQRTFFDIEMMEEMGFCQGIENYSRYFDGRQAGEPAYTLIDYFPDDFVLFVDESHITIPQVGGMYRGDRSPQGDPGAVRFPPAGGPGQPAAELPGVRGAHPTRRSTSRPPRPISSWSAAAACSSSRSSARPGWSIRSSRCGR